MNLREPISGDFDFYYELKCEPSSIYWGGFDKAPDRNGLNEHFNRFLRKEFPDRDFYILEDEGIPVGYLQLTHNSDTEIEIGYGVSERFRGRGCGYFLLDQAKRIISKMDGCVDLIGYVREDNKSSKKCFEKKGFLSKDEFVERYFAMDKAKVKMFLYIWNKLIEADQRM